MSEPVAAIEYQGAIQVRQYHRGTYLAGEHLEELIERRLGDRYSFGQGWRGFAVVSIALYEDESDLPAPAKPS
jgi:hypothetical protein